ncbi:MAG: hypothetical protein IK023_02460 [Bacteroidaceae bacterium]|nr:hypothetical protein [Bacteroidaceae bacterium]
MKKTWMMLAAIWGCMMMIGCSDNDVTDNPKPEDLADYTIIFYGYGGETLDYSIVNNMEAFFGAEKGSYDKVKIAAQYKFSSTDDMLETLDSHVDEEDEEYEVLADMAEKVGGQTVRFVVDPKISSDEVKEKILKNEACFYGEEDCHITDVDSLTNFINWATKTCPAKHYILIVSDHGGGYQPNDDKPFATKGVVYDDHDGQTENFTVTSLKYAIGRANARMEVIYFDACLMNTIEYQFELKDLTDYYVLSTFTVPGEGGRYDVLVDQLAEHGDDIETALANFNKATVDYWDETLSGDEENPDYDYHDMTITRTSGLAAFGVKMREFVNRLVEAYADPEKKAKIDNCTEYAFKVNDVRPNYDMVDYAVSICNALPEVFDDALYNQLATTFNACIVSQQCSDFIEAHDLMVDCSVMLAVKGNYYTYIYNTDDPPTLKGYLVYCADGKLEAYKAGITEPYKVLDWGSTLAATYQQLAFDKATGWSRWLLLNEQLPCIVSLAELHYALPEDEED